MKKLYLDLETTTNLKGKRRDPSPYIPDNRIVSYGYATKGFSTDSSDYHFLYHRDFTGDPILSCRVLQTLLDECDVLVAFNAKFELEWLLEAGFKYDGPVQDPMVTEYVLARGQRVGLSLDECCERRKTVRKLGAEIEEYWDKGIGFHQMPMALVERYGRRDVECLKELDECHEQLLSVQENKGLIPTIQMSWEFIRCLVEMERNGIYVNSEALDEVKKTFTKEYQALREELETTARSVMGDTPVNLDSPEQLSWLIYSRKVKDKHAWAKTFNIGTDIKGKRRKPPRMSGAEFSRAVKEGTTVLKRTSASHCLLCNGKGRVSHLFTKSGQPFKHPPKCHGCEGLGVLYTDTGRVAGFKLIPRGPQDTAAGGFATDKDTLRELAEGLGADSVSSAKSDLQLIAKGFLEKFIRYNAIGTYLDTFVKGIEEGRGNDGILHTQLMQCITRTGRLSSQRPNFQNLPRANTFPVRRVVQSRWRNGKIIEVDFAKLEYAVAVFLSQDKAGMDDIRNGVDAHSLTSKILTESGQPTSRQDAKARTFRPLYRGTTGTPAEIEYNKWFMNKHKGIDEWHKKLIETVLNTGGYATATGREFKFPGTKRLPNGYVVNSTQIANYAVQSVATADFVPCMIIEIFKEISKYRLQSKLILTVHDSIVFDCHFDEYDFLVSLINTCFKRLPEIIKRRYNLELNVEFGWEIKSGSDWRDMKVVA